MDQSECCICLDALCERSVAVLVTDEAVRVCPHYFHAACVTSATAPRGNAAPAERLCPMCRQSFASIVEMPDPITQPDAWFRLVDVDRSGSLSLQNVCDVVGATCLVDEQGVEALLAAQWAQWDADGSGRIDAEELPALLSFIQQKLPRRSHRSARRGAPVPSIVADKAAWFAYWDTENTGVLDRETTLAAVVRTCNAGQSDCVGEIASGLDTVWPVFAGGHDAALPREVFLEEDGLADTVVAMIINSEKLKDVAQEGRGRGVSTVSSVGDLGTTLNTSVGSGDDGDDGGDALDRTVRGRAGGHGRPRGLSHEPQAHAEGGHPAAARTSSGLVLLPTVNQQIPSCVVCGRRSVAGALRRSGWKCMTCVGRPHKGNAMVRMMDLIGCR